MFGSQAMATAIALTLLFFLLATATSAAVELVSKALKWRHRELEKAIASMLLDGDESETEGSEPGGLGATSVYRAFRKAAGKAGVTYMSAKSFADAAIELARKAENVPAASATRSIISWPTWAVT